MAPRARPTSHWVKSSICISIHDIHIHQKRMTSHSPFISNNSNFFKDNGLLPCPPLALHIDLARLLEGHVSNMASRAGNIPAKPIRNFFSNLRKVIVIQLRIECSQGIQKSLLFKS